jgi:hypothetical protein
MCEFRHVHTRSVSAEELDERSAPQSCKLTHHPRRDSNSGRPATKTGPFYLICVTASYFKIWSANERHEFEYNA